jgi:serine/threonine protein kinase
MSNPDPPKPRKPRRRRINSDAARALIGQVIDGKYLLEDFLGHGAMASVYRASTDGEHVAVKILHKDRAIDGTHVARFEQEAYVAKRLSHPNIVGVYDFGQTPNASPYLVMEFVDGELMSRIIARDAPLRPQRVVRIARQLFEALISAHAMGIIHRDLKPDNIIVAQTTVKTRKGPRRRDVVKVLDFGVAKLLDRGFGYIGRKPGEAPQTITGMIVGTPRYIAPEQVMAEKVTAQADLYTAGGVLYELLTGARPINAPTAFALALAHVNEAPDPPAIDGVPLRGPLIDLVMACLAKNPADRPNGAASALAMLENGAKSPISGTWPGDMPIVTLKPSKTERITTHDGAGFSSQATIGFDSPDIQAIRAALATEAAPEAATSPADDAPLNVRSGTVVDGLPYHLKAQLEAELAAHQSQAGPIDPQEIQTTPGVAATAARTQETPRTPPPSEAPKRQHKPGKEGSGRTLLWSAVGLVVIAIAAAATFYWMNAP